MPSPPSDHSPGSAAEPPASPRRALALLLILGALLVVLFVFVPRAMHRWGFGAASGPASVGPTEPLLPVPPTGPTPIGPIVPPRPGPGPADVVSAVAVAPLQIRVRDADDHAALPGALVEVRIYGPPKDPSELPLLVDPATVAPEQRDITRRRNLALLERSRPRLYHQSLLADADGVALFPDVPGGEAEIIATEREDRVSIFAIERHPVAAAEPGDVAARAPIVILLQRATGRITGRVIDDAGAPKPGAEILVVRNRPPVVDSRAYAFAKANPYHRTTAGLDGRFELPAIPVFDQYLVHARLQGWGADSSGYVAVERAAASDVTLTLRRDRVVTGTVRAAATTVDLTKARLVGYRVQDPAWRPGESLRVSLQAGVPVQPDAAGRYRLEAPNTVRYVVIEATLPGHAPVRVAVDFGAGAALAEVEQAVEFASPGRVLAGRVVDDAGRPVRAKVTFSREDESIQHAPLETDAAGRFHADWLADRTYTLVAEPLDPDRSLQPAIVSGLRPDRTDVELRCKP